MENAFSEYKIPDKFEGEIFLPATFYNNPLLNIYYVSNYGRIYSSRFKKFLIPQINHKGYHVVTLATSDNSRRANVIVHRLEMEVFKPIPNMELYQVNHIDGNKINNYIGNLEWCTPSYNVRHAYKNGLMDVEKLRSLTKEEIDSIRQKYIAGIPIIDIWKSEFADRLSYESISGICRNRTYKDPEYKMPKAKNFSHFNETDISKIRNLYNKGYSAKYIWENFFINYGTGWHAIERICRNKSFFDPNYIPRNQYNYSKEEMEE